MIMQPATAILNNTTFFVIKNTTSLLCTNNLYFMAKDAHLPIHDLPTYLKTLGSPLFLYQSNTSNISMYLIVYRLKKQRVSIRPSTSINHKWSNLDIWIRYCSINFLKKLFVPYELLWRRA